MIILVYYNLAFTFVDLAISYAEMVLLLLNYEFRILLQM